MGSEQSTSEMSKPSLRDDYKFKGFIAPVFTSFNEDLSINTEPIMEYAQLLNKSGIPGVLVLGTTGEGMSLTVEERKTIAEAWIAATRKTKQHVMIQIGGCPLPDVKELAAHAEKIGAESILCLPELYFKPKTAEDLIKYLEIVATCAPNTPLFYYHIPELTGVHINMEQFLNESVARLSTFCGIKYTSNDLAQGYDALKAGLGSFTVFLGADALIEPAFALGFNSVIATSLNILPEHSIDIRKAIKDNEIDKAKEIQEKLTAACKVIVKDGDWVPCMKAAMNLFTPIKVGRARPPLKNLTREQIEEIETNIKPYVI